MKPVEVVERAHAFATGGLSGESRYQF